MIKKINNKWCVLHGSSQKKGSKTDKPKGSVIKCYSGKKAKKKAESMHKAILISKKKK